MISQRYVALLRGVPVGSSKRLSVSDLRALVEQLGFTKVVSFHPSGNVVFDGASSAAGASAALEESLVMRLGVAARVQVLERSALEAIVNERPLLAPDCDAAPHPNPNHLFVFLFAELARRAALAALALRDWQCEALTVGRLAAYAWCPAGLAGSALAGELCRQLGDAVTVRPWPVVQRLHELCSDSARRR